MTYKSLQRLASLAGVALSGLLIALAAAVGEAAESSGTAAVTIASGIEGRAYWNIAARLKQVAARELDLPVEVVASAGSNDNLQRLNDPDSPVSLGLTQADALDRFLGEHPGFAAKMEIIETIGQECVFLIAGLNSDLADATGLQDPRGYRVAIPNPDSGVAATFANMARLQPGFANARSVFMDTAKAMDIIGRPSGDEVQAVMLVQRPKARTPEIKQALEAPEIYRFLPLIDAALVKAKLPTGEPVYSPLDVPLVRSGWNTVRSVKTVCTQGLLLAVSDKLSSDQRRKLARIMDFFWMQIYPTQE